MKQSCDLHLPEILMPVPMAGGNLPPRTVTFPLVKLLPTSNTEELHTGSSCDKEWYFYYRYFPELPLKFKTTKTVFPDCLLRLLRNIGFPSGPKHELLQHITLHTLEVLLFLSEVNNYFNSKCT